MTVVVDDTPTETILRVPAVDETGGIELFVDMLWDKKSATGEYEIIQPTNPMRKEEPEYQIAAAPVQRSAPGLIRRALGRAKAAIAKAVRTVKDAARWLFSDMPSLNPRLAQRFKNKFFGYRGKHNVQRAWYGVQRSTSASVVITRERHMRAQQTSRTKEGVLSSYFPLPEYWVSHMADLIQTIRDEHSVFHPSKGRHWECS